MYYDVAVIGGGPGGYTAAEKAAKAGLSVILFEQEKLGGTCLHRGCIPTKALLHASETYAGLCHANAMGIQAEGIHYDFSAMHTRKNEVVSTLCTGIEKLMKANHISVVNGHAKIMGTGRIACLGETYEAKDIIVAAGSLPSCPPIVGATLPGVYTSDDLLLEEGKQLQSLVIIGGGVIGVECASIYLPLHCQVTILEAMDHILPAMDREIAQRLSMFLKKRGAHIQEKVTVESIEGVPGNMQVHFLDKKGNKQVACGEGVLMATGRRANLDDLFDDNYVPALERNAIVADATGRTNLEHLYVIGDARAHNVQLAHVASAQAINAVAVITQKPLPVDTALIPSCVYTSPEIACVGMNEAEAKAAGIAVKSGKCLSGANGKSIIEGAESGYVKLIAEAKTNRLLGAQLVCQRASDMIGELALAIQKKLTVQELLQVIHPHPTFCEMIYEAAHNVR